MRRGSTALVLVIVLLGVCFAATVAQHGAARFLTGQTAAGLAGQQALRTAQALVDDATAALARAAGDPASPHHAELRRRLATATAATVDLTDLLPIVAANPGALSWKRAKQAIIQPVGTVAVDPVRAQVVDLRRLPETLDGRGALADELTALLEVRARVTVTLAGTAVSRTLTERRELKLVVAGPPRPFDQTALVIEDLSALTDVERANAQRLQLFAYLDETIAKIQSVQGQLAPDVAKELADIQAGAPRPDQRDRLMPKLPAERAGAVGLTRPDRVGFRWLDLAARLDEDVRELAGLHDRVLAAADRVGRDGGRELVARVVASLSTYNRAATRIWEYQRLLKVWPASSLEYRGVFGGYGERLGAAWYAPRTALALDPAGPLAADWAAGRRALHGAFELRAAQPVRLEGPRAGRTVLVVDAPSIELTNVTAARPGDLLTLVVTRGTVRLNGRVDAYVIVEGAAKIEMAADAALTGGLALRAGAAHQLAGSVAWSAHTVTGLTPAAALAQAAPGPYAVALSPVPLFTEGGR